MWTHNRLWLVFRSLQNLGAHPNSNLYVTLAIDIIAATHLAGPEFMPNALPTIKPSDSKAWTDCKRHVWLDNKATLKIIPSQDPFEQLIINLGLEYKKALLNALSAKTKVQTASNKNDPQRLMAEKVPVIYQAKLPAPNEPTLVVPKQLGKGPITSSRQIRLIVQTCSDAAYQRMREDGMEQDATELNTGHNQRRQVEPLGPAGSPYYNLSQYSTMHSSPLLPKNSALSGGVSSYLPC